LEEKEFNLRGVAVDVTSYELEGVDEFGKAPVVLKKVIKYKSSFSLVMKGITEELEWYFSKGLTNIYFLDNGKALRIEHEDGTYWVDLPADSELINFLKDFIEEA
jgi:hypothetical protein